MGTRKFDANVDVNGKVITNSIKYNTGNTGTTLTVGERRWNNNVGTTELSLKGGNVTLQDGQEVVMYVYNNSGADIQNGKAVTIVGSLNDIDVVELAIASDSGNTKFRVAGVSTELIPNNGYGFVTMIGQVHDLNLTGFSINEDVYLSQTTAGEFVHLSDLSISGRTIEIGKVTDNSANGILRVCIHNEFSTSKNTLGETQVFTANDTSTGVFEFGGLISASTTTFNIGVVKGWIVDNESDPVSPSIKYVSYSGSTSQTTPYLNSSTQTYVLLNSSNQIIYQTTYPTPTQRRQNIFLGTIIHSNLSSITAVGNSTDYVLSPLSQLRDMFRPIGLVNGGVYISTNGANLSLNSSGEYVYGLGINYYSDKTDPNRKYITAQTPLQFKYRTQSGGNLTLLTSIDPTSYDVAGTVTPIAGNPSYATNQRVYLTQEGLFLIQYGQTIYNKLTDAVAGLGTETFTVFTPFKTSAILIGVISVIKGATDLTNPDQAIFTRSSKFGEIGGGGGGAGATTNATLQDVYDNSTSPEILTNSTIGALSIKRGSGADTDNVFEILNGSNTITAAITGNGIISGATWQGTLISSQYGGTGVNNGGRTITITTNSGTFSFTNTGTTLTIANNTSVAGTNTGDVSLNTNSGLSLTGQQLTMGTPSYINATSTNSVTTNTHTHAISGLTTSNLSTTAGILNTQLANNSITIGATTIALGATMLSLSGLTSVSATTFTGSLVGNASSAAILQNARTIALSGDVVGTATSFNGSANITIPVSINTFSGSAKGLVPSSTGGTINYLREDGTWASPANSRTVDNFIASSGQTTFTTSTSYVVGSLDVYYNGSHLSNNEFNATNGTTVVLGFPCDLNDNVDIISSKIGTIDFNSMVAKVPISFSNTGNLTQKTGTHRFYCEYNCTILGVRASVGTQPTGNDIIVDINKNGSSIFTTQANRPKILVNTNTSGFVTNQDITTLNAGDYFTVDIDQVGSIVSGADLSIIIWIK